MKKVILFIFILFSLIGCAKNTPTPNSSPIYVATKCKDVNIKSVPWKINYAITFRYWIQELKESRAVISKCTERTPND